jgi:diguanylate cyclase (GGDEF)-like protein
MDRQRMLDMDARIRPLRIATLAVLGISLAAAAIWMPRDTILAAIIAVVAAGGLFWAGTKSTGGFKHPEYALFAGWAGSEVVIAASIIATGGPQSPAIAWLAIPIVTLSSRFSLRGVVVGVLFAEGLLGVASLSKGWSTFIDDPLLAGATMSLILCIGILSTALMISDAEHRTGAVIDPLTGLLNRAALRNRVQELAERSEYTAEPVGVIVGDIDHFKLVNDRNGHAVGDEVLKDIAFVMRNQLRAFDLIYRIGGEEFLVLLPGSGVGEAEKFANDLHRVIGSEPRGGQPVSMSFGVASSKFGDVFDYDSVFAAADAALYRAKNSGRDMVCVSDPAADGEFTAGSVQHVHA